MDVVDKLLASDEPSIRYKVRSNVLGEPADSPDMLALRQEIGRSPRVRALLADRDHKGRIQPAHHVYKKWKGAHWVLASLADIGYPECSDEIIPAVNQVFRCWLDPDAIKERVCQSAPPSGSGHGIPVIDGRVRRCASQQGNALFSTLRLGFIDERSHELARLLIRWQWPDGGWNCDCDPQAAKSSFWESLIPLRALSEYSKRTGNTEARASAERAADVFLKRRLFRRLSDGEVMNPAFIKLHYPCYWRYDILFGLKVMAEAGFIADPRCQDALDVLESKRLPDGGWPAEDRFYNSPNGDLSGADRVTWGGISKTRMNEWITADALHVLKSAGRL